MEVFPAIDLKEGQVVRLKQGDYNQKTIYNDDPVEQAQIFLENGGKWLHIVDLDGARGHKGINSNIVSRIKEKTGLKIQLGGGIRSLEAIGKWLEKGIERVVIGTLAIENPLAIKKAVLKYGPERFVISIDARNGFVATHGWERLSQMEAEDFAWKMAEMGVIRILYTDINRDGMLSGPDFESLKKLLQVRGINLIASGGVSNIDDLIKLKELGVEGVVVGKALYQGLISLGDILKELGE